MKRWQLVLGGLAAIAFCSVAALRAEDEGKKPSIKEIMTKCMKSGLCKKVASGQASAEETKNFVTMVSALPGHEAPMGDAESWKAKTAALVEAAQAVAAGKDGAGAALGKAANCAACHKAHKPA